MVSAGCPTRIGPSVDHGATPGPRLFVLACALVVACMACSRPQERPQQIVIATTTSVVNSGLMAYLAEQFRKESGIVIRVHAAGSGRALEMLSDGEVDLVISHAPAAEAQMLARHPNWRYHKIAANHFLIIGPADDPAHVAEAANVADVFRRITASRAKFVSRGDNSGTHERETQIWQSAGITPPPEVRLVSGSGMGATLRMADDQRAYTLSDDATFLQLRDRLSSKALFSNDPALINTYAVVYAPGPEVAKRLGDWLIDGKGHAAIDAFAVSGAHPFQSWPADCPAVTPGSPLCVAQ